MKFSSHALGVGLSLSLFCLLAATLVVTVERLTQARIDHNQKQATLHKLAEVLPPALYDNDVFSDAITLVGWPRQRAAKTTKVFRATKNGRPVAMVMDTYAPQGYNGDIGLLIAIHNDGRVLGVRVTRHRETPGLGDRIQRSKSAWITGFRGQSLNRPRPAHWAVKKDGGVFDQLTGATITPRAVVAAVKHALWFAKTNRDDVFKLESGGRLDAGKNARPNTGQTLSMPADGPRHGSRKNHLKADS